MSNTLHVHSKYLSRCCHSARLIVRSRAGGWVTQNCEQCGDARRVRLDELPELTCTPCGQTMEPGYSFQNYAYHCSKCHSVYRLWDYVPWWNELFEYCGVATPDERGF